MKKQKRIYINNHGITFLDKPRHTKRLDENPAYKCII